MLEPGSTAPVIVGATPARRYLCGNYVAVLNRDVRSIGPIEYLYVLVVFRSDNPSSPVLFVTAERNTLSALTLNLMPKEVREEMGADFGKSLFLGTFDESGHGNLGIANECSDIEVFATRALAIAKERLKLREPIQVASSPSSSLDTYVDQFERNLLATLAKIDEVDMDLPLCHNADDLYPKELRKAYAGTGHELSVPVNMALMFLMFTHSSNMREFHRLPSWWKCQFSDEAKRRHALIRAHTKIRNWLNAGHTRAWDHSVYPSFLTALSKKIAEVLGKHSNAQLDQLAKQLWMTKTPDLALWQRLAERALL